MLTKVGDAKTKTVKASEEEQIKVEVLGSYDNSGKLDLETLKTNLGHISDATVTGEDFPLTVTYASGNSYTVGDSGSIEPVTPPEPKAGIGVGNKADDNGAVDGKDASYSNPIIPKGFKAIDVGDAKWGTETGYQYGLVIEDAVEGSETVGSQFVWVPVENYSNFHRIEGYSNGNLQSFLSSSKEAGAEGSSITTTESIKMYKSVKDNEGFYIARYEAGVEGTTENYSLSPKTVTNGDVKPLSKAG